ncbi:hypothetical protein PHYBOEH_007804 [Phytophthora boehmeriae]|uniref:Uncharacterized protein n=1 Tax=Phytophthora boehmeriae TaxID=109152 RepID=A0A8T1W8M4_9STRA|nr:hypothetical protein PHYBOEH_007804 [Phytophthora boehmeriae]
MKIMSPAPVILALGCLLAQARALSVTQGLTVQVDSGNHSGDVNVTTEANFDPPSLEKGSKIALGAKIQVCPTGSCSAGKFMRLTVANITEASTDGTVVQGVGNFSSGTWSAMATAVVNGVNISSTSFVTTLNVGINSVGFNLTASIPQANTTVQYGNQTIPVPAGALKFTVDITGWKFISTSNTLTLRVSLESRGKDGKDRKPAKKPRGTTTGNATVSSKIERVDMGDSMFMDAPTIVFIDDVQANVLNSSVVEVGGSTQMQWVFPSFTSKLHYDPVLGQDSTSSNSTSSGSASGSSSAGATTPTPTTATPASSAVKMLPGLAAGVVAILTYCLF